ncbi:MAG: polysaccharide pyruvyl transferase family protein [PVC group bacterium]
MKVLFLNTHSTLNLGDTGIVLAQIQLLKEIFPEIKIALTSRTPKRDRAFYAPLGIKVYPPFIPAPGVFVGVWEKCLGCLKNLVDLRGKARLLREIKNSDLIISNGGGYFYSYRKIIPGPTFIQHAFHLKLAYLWNKPVIMFPQSFGPFSNSIASRLMKGILEDSNVIKIFVREEISLHLLSGFLKQTARKKIDLCPDLTLLLWNKGPRETDRIISSRARPRLALTLRDWNFPGVKGEKQKEQKREEYLAALLETSASFLDQFGGTVIIVPQVKGPGNLENDTLISKEFWEKSRQLEGRKNILLFPPERLTSPYDIIDLFSRSDLVVATRFHSALFALVASTPFISIGYQHKSSGMLRALGLEDFLVDIEAVSCEQIMSLIRPILNRPDDIRSQINSTVNSTRRRITVKLRESLKNFQ